MGEKYNLWRRLILAVVLLGLILTGFFVYLRSTRRRTLERNANYLADAATQTAKRIDDLLIGAENNISAIAHMYEQSLDPSVANVELLEEMTESTVFDYIGFVDAKGFYTDNRGLQADVTDRAYVQDGLRGNTGMDVIFDGRVSGEDLVIFLCASAKEWRGGWRPHRALPAAADAGNHILYLLWRACQHLPVPFRWNGDCQLHGNNAGKYSRYTQTE